ncbi:hypothetical protein ZRA01_00860 [Zoogloea ramigera]|uniref:Uncharacterized protein n=1 Tax=Zoogloea ramigera TaxID=350 RepID=A0A4Y4CRZ2_ZOORA|nr:hypothetical protein ZRA01_00860 [Zoogloea ramigera]
MRIAHPQPQQRDFSFGPPEGPKDALVVARDHVLNLERIMPETSGAEFDLNQNHVKHREKEAVAADADADAPNGSKRRTRLLANSKVEACSRQGAGRRPGSGALARASAGGVSSSLTTR